VGRTQQPCGLLDRHHPGALPHLPRGACCYLLCAARTCRSAHSYFSATQTVHIDFEDRGCFRSLGISYTVVARSGLAANNPYRSAPESFSFGTAHQNADDIDFFWLPSDTYRASDKNKQTRENIDYWLWIRIPGKCCRLLARE